MNETAAVGSGHDVIRRKYLAALHAHTGRNVIAYYSGWLQKQIQGLQPFLSVNDSDKNGFMAAIHQLDRSKGLDLVLHTPGGDTAATESLVDYLRQMFGTDIRAIVPQLAMSAGTMISLACKEIILGKHSNLGPIDPQIGFMPANGVLEEFSRAAEEIQNSANPQQMQARIALWQPIIAKYNPTLIGQCQNAITWSKEITENWLVSGMFAGDSDAAAKATRIVDELSSHTGNRTHARHIHRDRLEALDLKVVELEHNQEFQDAVLSLHHACIDTLTRTPTFKIIENQNGVGYQMQAQLQNVPASGNVQAASDQPEEPKPPTQSN